MTLPTTQKAFQLEKDPNAQDKKARNLALIRQVEVPKDSDGKVIVKILASGFNRRDEWGMMGQYPGLIYKNSTFGCDGAGIIVSDQNKAKIQSSHPDGLVLLIPTRGWQSDPSGPEAELPGAPKEIRENELGGKGFGLLGCTGPTNGVGTFCEYVQVGNDQIVDAPKHLDAVHSAAIPCGGVTAFRALFTKAQLNPNQNLLLKGVGGGVAQLALQLAIAAGAKVFVTGGSQSKIDRAIKMGASGGAIYKDSDWPKKIRSLLPKDRPFLDSVVDSAGGNIPVEAQKAGLRDGGKVVCFGMTATPKITCTMREVLRNVEILGSTMGSAEEFKACVRFIEKHKIVPSIDTVLSGLEEADKGFALLQDAEKRSAGKVIVEIARLENPKAKL